MCEHFGCGCCVEVIGKVMCKDLLPFVFVYFCVVGCYGYDHVVWVEVEVFCDFDGGEHVADA